MEKELTIEELSRRGNRNFFVKLLCAIGNFFANIGLSIAHFFRFLPRNLKRIGLGIGHFFKRLGHIFVHGSIGVKLSYLFMGAGAIAAKQFVKGLLYLAVEAGFIVFMVFAGGNSLAGLFTLGTKETMQLPSGGIQMGDNSMLMLLYGIATIMLCITFVVLYFMNIFSADATDRKVRAGGKATNFVTDLKSLLSHRFNITLLVVPIIGIVIFTLLPLCYMILISFTNFDAVHQPPGKLFEWIGFENFVSMLTRSDLRGTFFPVLGWTIIWAILATFSNYFGGIAVALLINKKGIRCKAVFRTVFVMTIAVPQFISLLVVRTLFNDYGAINGLLQQLGWINKPIGFFTDPALHGLLPKTMIVITNLWVGIPFTMLITTGILMNIPADLYEAARIDGANAIKIFAKITIPYVLFVTAPYLITQFIGNINNFNLIYLLTGGGPSNYAFFKAGETDLLVTWLYKLTTDVNKDYNLASVIGIFTFIISSIISIIAYSQTSSYKNEGDFS